MEEDKNVIDVALNYHTDPLSDDKGKIEQLEFVLKDINSKIDEIIERLDEVID